MNWQKDLYFYYMKRIFLGLIFIPIFLFAQKPIKKGSNSCTIAKYIGNYPDKIKHPHFRNYDKAYTCQANTKKPILIYFTAFGSVNSRSIEMEFLNDSSISKYLDKFVFTVLFVDKGENAEGYYELAEKKYDCKTQPSFVILPYNQRYFKRLKECNKTEFIKFITEPVPENPQK